MPTREIAFNLPQGSYRTEIEIPAHCSVCNHLIPFNIFHWTFCKLRNELHVVISCANPECLTSLICYYHLEKPDRPSFVKVEPPNLTTEQFPEVIQTNFPSFITVYDQAHEAKERGLDQIAGPGYRKAFEFLIKDYAKSKASSDQEKEEIDRIFSGQVVERFISDKRIQSVAKRALWLGNDETHYLRKWEDQDITDLIRLIKLTIHWIEIEHESQGYETAMPEPTKKSSK